jgi:hypothetical protein
VRAYDEILQISELRSVYLRVYGGTRKKEGMWVGIMDSECFILVDSETFASATGPAIFSTLLPESNWQTSLFVHMRLL